jgi:DnaJ-class molecular chaperone
MKYKATILQVMRYTCPDCNKYVEEFTAQNEDPCPHCSGLTTTTKQYKIIDVVKYRRNADGSRLRWIEKERVEI